MRMKCVEAIYFSPTGTSKKGAEAIAESLSKNWSAAEMTVKGELPDRTVFGQGDLVVFGAPVYGGRLYRGCAQRFRTLQGENTPCVVTVTYGNRHYDDALLELSDLAAERGFIPVAAAALVGQHTYGEIQVGRPDENDIKEDEDFAGQVLKKLDRGDFTPVSVPGNRPYVKGEEGGGGGRFRPLTDLEKCAGCGLCAKVCPEGAIDRTDNWTIDDKLCISCFRCIRICPTGAKNMNTREYQAFAREFSKKLSARRENEYFL